MPEHVNTPTPERDNPPTATTPTIADKMLDALRAHPSATSAQLADAASVGRSAAAKALAALARDSRITRTAGIRAGGTRAPDQWHAVTPPAAADPTDPAATDQAGAHPAGADQPVNEALPPAAHRTSPAAGPRRAAKATTGTNRPAKGDAAKGKIATGKMAKGKVAKGAARVVATDTTASDAVAAQEPTGTRLKSGALRGQVEQFLADHPDEHYTPTALGHLLGRSSGAIANALEKLVADNYALLVTPKPRSYRSAPPE